MGCGASTVVPFMQTVAGELVNSSGQKQDAATLLQGKVKLVLFSANFPGDLTTNFVQFRLIPLYNALKAKGANFEVVFVSDDTAQQAFDAYFQSMPWWAVPFPDANRRSGLRYILGAQGPSLFVLGEEDDIVTTEGISEVQNDPSGGKFPWRPSKMEGLIGAVADEL